MADQLPIFGGMDLLARCKRCQAEIQRRSQIVCMSCRNVIVANRDRVLDMGELLEHVRGHPGQPIGMERWAQICRASKADTPDATRRAWERLKTWLRTNNAPAEAEEDEQGHGAKPLRLRRGFDQWLAEQEETWLGWGLPEDADYSGTPVWGADEHHHDDDEGDDA